MGVGRVWRILWGPNQENLLDLNWPTVGDNPTFWREPREASERVVVNNLQESWITGRNFFGKLSARWFGMAQWAGTAGLQAFFDSAGDSNPFTLVPDVVNTPDFQIPNCFLADPFDKPAPGLEGDGTQSIDFTFWNAAYDLGLAFRGLLFELAGGVDITQPLAGSYTRGGSVTYHNVNGFVRTVAANVLRNAHYLGPKTPTGTALGPMILIETGRTNSCLQSETLDNATWGKTGSTVSPNVVLCPDGTNVTADKVVESVGAGNHLINQPITITSGESIAWSFYVHAAERFKGRIQFSDTGTTNGFRADFDLIAGTIANAGNVGAGVYRGSNIEYLANGWARVSVWGEVNGAVTAGFGFLILEDGTGAISYTGDGASGMYGWGGQAERCGTNPGSAPTSYLVTVAATVTRTADTVTAFTFPFTWPMQSLTEYVKIVDLCPVTSAVTAFGVSQIGDTAFTAPRHYIVKSTNSWSTNLGNEFGGSSTATSGALASTYGDVVELHVQLDMTNMGSVTPKLQYTTNGTLSGPFTGAAIVAPQSWHQALISVGPFANNGAFGILKHKIAAGVKDLPTMQGL